MANCIASLCKLGFSPTRSHVKDLVKEYVETNSIETFKNNWPAKNWLRLFMDRNNLSMKKANLISSARKSATENQFVIFDFYEVLEEVIQEKNLFDKPQHIWNCDESGFPSDPKKVKVVSIRGKTAYSVTGRENTTTLAVANAAGKALPPLIVFQGKHFQSTWMSENCIPGTWYSCSENGWILNELFAESFREFCAKIKERPLVLLYNSHLKHVSVAVMRKVREENITIIKFPPHVTDVLQPLEVTCFGPLK